MPRRPRDGTHLSSLAHARWCLGLHLTSGSVIGPRRKNCSCGHQETWGPGLPLAQGHALGRREGLPGPLTPRVLPSVQSSAGPLGILDWGPLVVPFPSRLAKAFPNMQSRLTGQLTRFLLLCLLPPGVPISWCLVSPWQRVTQTSGKTAWLCPDLQGAGYPSVTLGSGPRSGNKGTEGWRGRGSSRGLTGTHTHWLLPWYLFHGWPAQFSSELITCSQIRSFMTRFLKPLFQQYR